MAARGTSIAEAAAGIRAVVDAGQPTITGGGSLSNLYRPVGDFLAGVADFLGEFSGDAGDENNREALTAAAERVVAEIAREAGVTPSEVIDELGTSGIVDLLRDIGVISSDSSQRRYGGAVADALDALRISPTASPDAVAANAEARAARIRMATPGDAVGAELAEEQREAGRDASQGAALERFLAKENADVARTRAQRARERVAQARQEAFVQFAGLDRLIAGVDPQTGEPIPQQFIGVPEGYYAERNIPDTLGTASTTALERLAPTYARDPATGQQADFVPQAPLYEEGAQYDPAGWSVERRGRLQAELVRAGLYEGDFTWGAWDPATMEAYSRLLGYANMTGVTDRAAARELQTLQNPDLNAAIAELRATEIADREAELPPLPDLATLRSTIRSQVSQFIGAEATDEEMSVFLTALDSEYQAAREAERQLIAQQVDYDLAQDAQIPDQYQTGLYGSTTSALEEAMPGPAGARPAGPERAIDPEARLAEQVRTRLAPQRALLDSVEADTTQQSNIAAGVSRIFARRRGA